MARSKKKNKTSIGCLFWIALILLVLVIFLFNRETIQNVLDETGFMEIIQKEKQDKPPEVEQVEVPDDDENVPAAPEIEITETIETPEQPSEKPEEEEVIALEVEPEKSEPETAPVETPEPDRKVRRSKMYFIEVGEDGNINLKSIVRPVYYIDSPLTETIKTLLDGFPVRN